MASDPRLHTGFRGEGPHPPQEAGGAEIRAMPRSETEHALRLAEARLAAISAAFRGLLVHLSPDGVIQSLKGQLAEGDRERYEGRSVFDILPAGPGAEFRPILNSVVESGETARLSYASELTDRVYEGQIGPLSDDGQILGAVAVLTDVTRRARAEKTVRDSEEGYRAVAENMTDVVVVCDVEGRVLFASANAGEIFAGGPDGWIGRSIVEGVHPDDLPRAMAEFARGRATAQPWRVAWRALPLGDEIRWFETNGSFITLPKGEERAILVSRNITAQKQIEEELRESRTFYRLLSEIHSDLHFAFEIDAGKRFRIRWGAQSAAQMAGRANEEYADVADWPWRRFVHPEDQERGKAWAKETIAGRNRDPLEWRRISRNGEGHWMRTWIVRMPDPEPGVIRGIGSTIDITESKRTEEARQRYEERLESEVAARTRELEQANAALRQLQTRLMHAERIRASEHLAGAIAHSINNPLTALIGTIQMHIEQSGELDPQSARVLQLARRIRLVVDRTLQLFRAGSLQLTRHRPGEILDAVCVELSERVQRAGIELKTSVESGLPKLTVDHALLSTALLSICENAIDAMPDGGVLSLEAFRVAGTSALVLRIEDTGPGIPGELRERVFQPFFTTKGGGTGLGLAIARGVVEGHEGCMRIESNSSGGTRVTVELPIAS